MKRLIETISYKIINSENISLAELKSAIDDLIEKVVGLGAVEKNPDTIFRTLHYTRFCLQALQESFLSNGEGKKCVGATLCH